MIKEIYIDTNILVENFIPDISKIKFTKNLQLYEEAINNYDKLIIDGLVVVEMWHLIFKRTYKKISKLNNTEINSLKSAGKNTSILGRVNAIAELTFNTIKNTSKVFINMDYVEMLEVILKHKISSFDFLIADKSKKNLLTGDEDLKEYINN